jgi:excinuclease ABC subunit C
MEQVKTGMRVIEKNDLKRQALANLKDLKQILGLAKTPVRIVCFDISNLGETEAVAGMTCFVKGEPSRGDYRKFRIKSVEGQNDFAMMNEAVSRYLGHIGQPGWERPDLILIDGGPGQLSAAMEALKAADEPNIEVISLAKRFEEVYVPGSGDPVIIPLESPASLLLRRVRDETHRFAISFHRTSRQKRFFKSILDDVPGLGPERKKLLIRKFRGIDNIAGLDYDAFKGMGIPVKTIKLLLEKLNKNQP